MFLNQEIYSGIMFTILFVSGSLYVAAMPYPSFPIIWLIPLLRQTWNFSTCVWIISLWSLFMFFLWLVFPAGCNFEKDATWKSSSIHGGMHDSTKTGYCNQVSTDSIVLTKICILDVLHKNQLLHDLCCIFSCFFELFEYISRTSTVAIRVCVLS